MIVRPALADIKAANARRGDRGALVAMSRPLGPYLAWFALRLGLTPRQVNYFSLTLVFGILGLVTFGGEAGRLAGTALVFVWQIVDVTDGTMARALGIRDNFGGFVDYATGMLIASFLPLCLGVGLWLSPEGSLGALLERIGRAAPAPEVLALMAGAGISVIALYIRLINRVLLLRFGEALAGSRVAAPSSAPRGPARWLHGVANNLEAIGGLQAVVLFAGAALGGLEVVLVGYFLFYCALLAVFAGATHRGYRDRTRYLAD